MGDSRRIYRRLLRLYPARFREEYTAPLERQFLDEFRETHGKGQRALFWLRALRDLAVSIPIETVHELKQDLGYAFRVYRRRSLVTILALAALALGIGASTAVFSVLNALLIRSLPFRQPERLVEIQTPPVGAFSGRSAFYRWRDSSSYSEEIATYSVGEMNLDVSGDAVRTRVAETSAGFFALFGIEPAFGRAFSAIEDSDGHDGVAVISHGLWEQFFGGDPQVLGRTIRLNGTPMTVIGVAPLGFDYPGKTQVWTPTAFDVNKLPKSGAVFWETVARLRPGLTIVQAQSMFIAEVTQIEPRLLDRNPIGTFIPPTPMLISLRDRLAGTVRQPAQVLMGVVAFVLLIACANVAHLLLSRYSERRQELAIRAALGASRARLVQQLITESTLLTVAAAGCGLIVARWASRLAGAAQPAQLAAQDYMILDWHVLAFTVCLAVLTGIVFGILPAILMGRVQPYIDPLRIHVGVQHSGSGRMRSLLIAMQAALTLVLLAGSFLMGRTFLRLLGTDLGFRTDNVVTMNISLAGTRHEVRAQEALYYDQVLERLRALPGVEYAGAASYLPLADNFYAALEFSLDAARKVPAATLISASTDYFRTMRTELLEGREFSDADRADSEPVIIVNDAFARRLGAGARIVGLRLSDWQGKSMIRIVGVVRTQRLGGPADSGLPQVFMPMDQYPPQFVTFVARVGGSAESHLAACRDAVKQVDPQVPVYDVKTLDQRLADNLARPRFYTAAILFFGGFALLIALIGIYGVVSYSIAQRTHEIAVRLAVGAEPGRLRTRLLYESMLPMILGMAAGIAGAFAVGRSLEHLISTAPPLDVRTCVIASFTLSTAAATAVWTASQRILRIDPANSLRAE